MNVSVTRNKLAMLYGLRVLIRAKDCPHKLRWQAIEKLAELEAEIAEKRITKMPGKTSRLSKLIEAQGEQVLPGQTEKQCA